MGNPDDERPTEQHAAVADPLGVTPDPHLEPGTEVGGYVIDGELGSGGMGVVYSATHPVIGKRAAIKVLKPELSNHPAAVERFVLEARAVNQIGHPNIVDIFAFGALPDGRSYYVMDLLVGESLRRRLKRTGALHISEAATIIDEVASALIAAHDKGIIHRDLKPDNVFMVTVPGRWPEVRILDWGLLKLSSQQSAVSSGKYRTLAGSVLGTPVYMSPEQARASNSVDARTDIYSLGVMAYEILSGGVPFKRGTSIDTLLAHQDEPVPPLAQRCPALPDELVQLIEAMLAKEPEGRPTLAAVRAVLRRLKGNKIPTMTAAGLSLPEIPLTPFVDPPDSSHATVDERGTSLERTRARQSDPTVSHSDVEPLPAPPSRPSTPALDSMHSLPYQSINISAQQTLAGHSMPAASNPRLKTPPAGSPSQPFAAEPQPPPAPRSQPFAAEPHPPTYSPPNIAPPAYSQPPPYSQPSIAPPAYSQPNIAPPAYSQPNITPPAYSQPNITPPGYGSPFEPHPSQPPLPAERESQPYPIPPDPARAAMQPYTTENLRPAATAGSSRRVMLIAIAALALAGVGVTLLLLAS